MAAHEGGAVGAEAGGEVATLLHGGDEQAGVGEVVAYIPHGDRFADDRGHVEHGAQRDAGDAKGQHGGRVVVHHGHHVGARLVDAPVDGPLGVHRAALLVQRFAFQRVLHEIRSVHQLGSARPGQDVAVGAFRMADADVAEGVHHFLAGEDAVGCDQVLKLPVEVGHMRSRRVRG